MGKRRCERIGAFIKIGVPIIVVLLGAGGAWIRLEYRRREKNKQREHEAKESDKNYKREINKMILDSFLSSCDFSNFSIEELKNLSEGMSDWLLFKKKEIDNENNGDLIAELEKIKKENDDLVNKTIMGAKDSEVRDLLVKEKDNKVKEDNF